jgi:hypothetical protein
VPDVIYQHPLAYLLGLEGIALLRAFGGEYDREFTHARFREIRALLDRIDELGDGVDETPMSVQEGYAQWAPWYDEPGNDLLDREQPVVREILDALPVGVSLDAACGTPRAEPAFAEFARVLRRAPAATNAACHDAPLAIVWHFALRV